MSKATLLDYIQKYEDKMYEKPATGHLRTGDVVRLELNDIEKIARHESVLELFRHFDENPEYSPKLWAILNKSCDMVHEPENKRYFKHNLFLVPLQMLRSALRKGTLGDLLYSEDLIAPENLLTDAYKKYFSKKARYKNPYDSAIPQKQYYVDLNKTVIDPAVAKIKELIEGQVNEIDSLSELLNGLIKLTESNEEIQEDLKSLKKSDEWEEELNKYNKRKINAQEKNSKIILKTKEASIKIADLALNQLDSQGMFFYEPMINISNPTHDLAYIIQLEDLITIKIAEPVQQSGELIQLLQEKREAMLTRNFSDRLLNIMGNYFSKIGTPDIMSEDILLLYKNVFSGEFYTSINEYNEQNKYQ